MRYSRAHSYEASRPLEDCHLRGKFVSGWRARLCDAARANVGRLQGVAFTPVGWERLSMYLQALFAFAFGSRVNGHWVLMSGKPQNDRRERPEGINDVKMSRVTQMNYYRPGDARGSLKRVGLLRAMQPREWNDEKERWQGEANQIAMTWHLVELLGVPRAEVEAELEQEEAERLAAKKAQAQLEGQQRAGEQAEARSKRGVGHPLVQIKRPQRKAAARVLELPTDAEGRRIPHTFEERRRHQTILFEMGQDPKWRDRSDLLRGAALARWREELEPPT